MFESYEVLPFNRQRAPNLRGTHVLTGNEEEYIDTH